MWKPYDLISWSWHSELDRLQIVFFTKRNLSSLLFVEVHVSRDNEPAIRQWLKRHMPSYWQI